MKKLYVISLKMMYCEDGYDYVEDVRVSEILPDGTESPQQSLPARPARPFRKDSPPEYVLEIDIPKIESIFGLSLSEIQKRIDFFELCKQGDGVAWSSALFSSSGEAFKEELK